MHGKGEYCWGDGHKYIGHFENGKQHGPGLYTWPTGGQYNGNWKLDKMNGFGRYTRNDGVIYVGVWKDDHQYGLGLKIVPERVCYGVTREMFRRRKFREIWSVEKKLIFHREIVEYPDVYSVWTRRKLLDVEIVFQERDGDEYDDDDAYDEENERERNVVNGKCVIEEVEDGDDEWSGTVTTVSSSDEQSS